MRCKMTYTHLIWDFNGTILEDMAVGLECVNLMLSKRDLPTVGGLDEYRRLFCFPIMDYYRMAGFDFEKEDYYTVLAPEWVGLYKARMDRCGLCPNITQTVQAVREKGLSQIVLSATQRDQLLEQLALLGVGSWFDDVLGLDNIHAHSKAELAVRWKQQHPDATPLFVGDTEHDAETARAIGADCLLYTGGHQSAERLSACGYPLITSLLDVLEYL